MEPIKPTLINLKDLYGYSPEECFYCSDPNGSITMGFSAQKISVHEYQDLLDRGWTRCGFDYYKKDIPNGCCKLYTIRMEAAKYQMRKSHKKALKKWNRYLAGEDVQSGEKEEIIKEEPKKVETEEEIVIMKALGGFLDWIKENPVKINQILGLQGNEILFISEKLQKEFKVIKGSVKKYGDYTTNLLMLLFIENQARLGTKDIADFVDKIRDLAEEILGSLLENIKVNIQKNGYIGFVLDKPAQKREKSQVIKEEIVKRQPRKFEIKFEKAGFDLESFGVYQRYCKEVYKKDQNEAGYTNFLCLQGLEFGEIQSEEAGKILKLGCYHMKYYIDEKLIAVGVVDLLPKAFSAAYFFYEPEYKFLRWA